MLYCYFPNFRTILLYLTKNENRKFHQKIPDAHFQEERLISQTSNPVWDSGTGRLKKLKDRLESLFDKTQGLEHYQNEKEKGKFTIIATTIGEEGERTYEQNNN